MDTRRVVSLLGVASLGMGCCYYASDAEVAKVCSDPELHAITRLKDLDQREAKGKAWGEKNLSSAEAKGRLDGLLRGGMSLSERVQIYDAWAKKHGLDQCKVAHADEPAP